MTTNIFIRTNGNYVSEGSIVINGIGQDFKVGPGTNVERSFGVPHGGATISMSINERDATMEERDATMEERDEANPPTGGVVTEQVSTTGADTAAASTAE